MVKVGGGLGQDPATEVTHLGLKQPPVFFSAIGSLLPMKVVLRLKQALASAF